MNKEIKQLLDKYPFMSFVLYGTTEYIGIIQNSDQYITNIYDIGRILDSKQKERFLELGDQYWWESNRKIPINIFLKQDWVEFRFCLRTLNSKDTEIKYGPQVNLRSLSDKRIKRKSIVLIKKVN